MEQAMKNRKVIYYPSARGRIGDQVQVSGRERRLSKGELVKPIISFVTTNTIEDHITKSLTTKRDFIKDVLK